MCVERLFIAGLVCSAAILGQQIPKPDSAGTGLTSSKRLSELDEIERQVSASVYAGNDREVDAVAEARLGEAYANIAKDTELSRKLIGRTLALVLTAKQTAKGAAQVSQVADEAGVRLLGLQAVQTQTVIAQNQQIIALLEQLAKKREPATR